jgi:hypothetical protein
MQLITIFLFGLLISVQSFASNHMIPVGQGISSPTITSTVNYSNGFTQENPAGVAYQNSIRLSGHFDFGDHDDDSSTDDIDGFGGEFGVGNGQYGFALGYYERDCDTCEEEVAGALGAFFGGFGIGLRFEEELYSAGIFLNPTGQHRLGAVVDLNDPDGEDNNITSYGVGYAFVHQGFTFSLDASKRDYETPTTNEDMIMVSPGLMVRIDKFALSVTHDSYIEEDEGAEVEDNTWWGFGYGSDQDWSIGFYHDYVNEWTVVGSLYF